MPPPPPDMAPPTFPLPRYEAHDHQPFQRVGPVTRWIGILLMIFIPLQLLAIVGLFQLRDKARDYLNEEISEDAFNDANRTNLGSLAGFLIIPIAVLTIVMMFRMAKNLQALGRTDATWSPGWAIGGWFCPPCAVYVIPWLMFRELWKGSDPSVPPGDPSWKSGSVPATFNVWWVLYGLVPLVGLVTSAGVLSNISNLDSADLAERFDDFLAVNVVLAFVSAVSAVVYLLMIRQLAERHLQAIGE
jgi:ABC-type Fe3+ transport system permease subunit